MARNPLRACGDYPYVAPAWNLSPITFQAGSFTFRRQGQLPCRTGSIRVAVPGGGYSAVKWGGEKAFRMPDGLSAQSHPIFDRKLRVRD
ncbi:hypothetical protein NCCP2145_15580 [Pseudarthrobacter sp. NCCP-2145]|nr:hypothetical protein GCM10017547_08940 [Pseudarthrobacter oxydans]GKV72177.1 hypothetical protein NCCP2145_15580 [Pseudarthrobacter sp. NCCP-2145]